MLLPKEEDSHDRRQTEFCSSVDNSYPQKKIVGLLQNQLKAQIIKLPPILNKKWVGIMFDNYKVFQI